jgi:hypothetical protein
MRSMWSDHRRSQCGGGLIPLKCAEGAKKTSATDLTDSTDKMEVRLRRENPLSVWSVRSVV